MARGEKTRVKVFHRGAETRRFVALQHFHVIRRHGQNRLAHAVDAVVVGGDDERVDLRAVGLAEFARGFAQHPVGARQVFRRGARRRFRVQALVQSRVQFQSERARGFRHDLPDAGRAGARIRGRVVGRFHERQIPDVQRQVVFRQHLVDHRAVTVVARKSRDKTVAHPALAANVFRGGANFLRVLPRIKQRGDVQFVVVGDGFTGLQFVGDHAQRLLDLGALLPQLFARTAAAVAGVHHRIHAVRLLGVMQNRGVFAPGAEHRDPKIHARANRRRTREIRAAIQRVFGQQMVGMRAVWGGGCRDRENRSQYGDAQIFSPAGAQCRKIGFAEFGGVYPETARAASAHFPVSTRPAT